MRKKILGVFIVIAMLMGVMPVYAAEDVTVYVSVSKYGDVVKSKDGDNMAYVPVVLTGKDSYTLDDAFVNCHKSYYEDGVNGYASSESDWGFGVDMLWGDTSYNFGYQVNGGSESVMGPGHEVDDGDFIDVIIYKNAYPDTESYATFDKHITEAKIDEVFEITLSYVSGYDDSWNSVFSPCVGATITINGEETEFVTDEDGKAYIEFEESGVVCISAKKEKLLKDNVVPAITAPVCVVDVKENSAIKMIHNLADRYAEISFEDAAGNLPWIIADMMVYEEIYETELLSDSRKKEALSLIVDSSKSSEKAGDMAKAIIAIRSLGYDAKNIITKEYDKVNLVKNLTDLIDNMDESVTNIYTLPYVMIALSQEDGYATEEQMEYLITSAIESKDSWQITEYGTDAMTPMIQALSPYYNDNVEVKTVIDETVEIVKAEQREDGLIDGFDGYESASTALAICAFSAIGVDCATVKNGGNSLIDGLMSTANAELNKVPNAFADEQGLRGLLAWQLFEKNMGIMYDFSDYPIETANIPEVENCPVIFEVTPSKTLITLEGATAVTKNCFDLSSGSYKYTATASGYKTETGTVLVSVEDAENNIKKVITISLDRTSSGGGGSATSDKDDKEDVKESVEKQEQEEIHEEKEKIENDINIFPDVKKDDWYYSAVKYAYENNIFSGTDKGFEPNALMTRAMLVTVLHRLSGASNIAEENPFKDVDSNKWYSGSIRWAAENGIVSGVTKTEFAPDTAITREQLATIIYRYADKYGYVVKNSENADVSAFSDYSVISKYALDAIEYVVGAGIMTGRNVGEFCPKENATRAEVASMLMRFEGIKAE